jgi:hypothetical protein
MAGADALPFPLQTFRVFHAFLQVLPFPSDRYAGAETVHSVAGMPFLCLFRWVLMLGVVSLMQVYQEESR